LIATYERLDLGGVLLGWDAERATGRAPLENAWLARICAQSEGRFVGFGSVDPLRRDAIERLQQFPELSLRGVKLHPTLQGFDPADDAVLPFFDAAAELGLGRAYAFGHKRSRRRRTGRPRAAHRPRAPAAA
jgi:predicted TIM-barrel fold metal-dependent hydrolase